MKVQMILNNGIIVYGETLHDVLKEMHSVAVAVGTDDGTTVPSKSSGIVSYISWIANRIYRRSHVDISVQDETRFVVSALKHGWIREIRFTNDELHTDYDLWCVDFRDIAESPEANTQPKQTGKTRTPNAS